MNKEKIITNGFFVDRDTGECFKEDYFVNDGMSIKSRDFGRFNVKLKIRATYDKTQLPDRIITRKQYFENNIGIYIFRKMNSLLNCLDAFINSVQREKLFTYITIKKPQSINEMYISAIEYVIKRDLPITTKKLIDIIANELNSDRFNLYQIANTKTLRKYYWLILKHLNDIPYINDEKRMKFFKSIKRYYDLIRFKLAIACDPTHLIGFLVYEMINHYCPYIPKKLKTHKKLGTSYFFKLGHREQLEMINKRELDKNIELKLIF